MKGAEPNLRVRLRSCYQRTWLPSTRGYTQKRGARERVEVNMASRNITLSLPEDTLQEVKMIAVRRRTSVSALLRGVLEDLVDSETGYRSAEQDFMDLLEQGLDLGTDGRLTGSRDELHER